jgi:hypothetical protein
MAPSGAVGAPDAETILVDVESLTETVVAELLSYFSGDRAPESGFDEFEARYIAGRILALVIEGH